MPDRKEAILDAAVAIADERGLDAVSMRSVAERVGVTPMALYPYVGNKAALLDGMLGRLLRDMWPGESPWPAGGAAGAEGDQAGQPDWRTRLLIMGRALRDIAKRHPWAASLVFARPAVTPDSVRAIDVVYGALLEAGVPAGQVPRLERLLGTVVFGFAASEAGGRFDPSETNPRSTRGLLPEGPLPGHAALADVLAAPADWDAEFEADIADLGEIIEATARRAREHE
ncbi:MAG TPA: TetR/AcrR family transcriptional regulator [Streptosporangiaceae bacterium]|nr:TetR/AcrR family transcriptional regulator [Streptosporangiaceae bacterium]